MNLLYNTLLFSLFFSYYTMSSFQISESANMVGDIKSIYDIEINDIDDNKINLKDELQ